MTSANEARPGGHQGASENGHEKQSAKCDSNTRLLAFFNVIHGADAAGFIEIRRFAEGHSTAAIERRWYRAPNELCNQFELLLEASERQGTGLFFGVLRRREEGVGSNGDVLSGKTLWVDIDFHDFDRGEQEARDAIKRFPIAPTIVVRSGHGLHLYFGLREAADPLELSALCERLAQALGGDHVHDPARLLRLPGSVNRKDPQHLVQVEFEVFEPGRVFNTSEVEDALDLVEDDGDRSGCDDGLGVDDKSGLPPRVRALIQQRKRIGGVFNGTGKPEIGPDGKALDTSSSGYDYSLVLLLAKAGVRDPRELALALKHRPDGAALAKGDEYVDRTVAKVLEVLVDAEQEAADVGVDFVVERVRIFNSNPARFEVWIDGRSFTLTSAQLRSPNQFSLAYVDAMHRLPRLPNKSEVWALIVNRWLNEATVETMPPEASREPRLIEAIERIIKDMPVGEAAEDLDHGKALLLPDGERAFKAASILRRLREDWNDVEAADVSRLLKSMGYASRSATIAGAQVRVWSLQ